MTGDGAKVFGEISENLRGRPGCRGWCGGSEDGQGSGRTVDLLTAWRPTMGDAFRPADRQVDRPALALGPEGDDDFLDLGQPGRGRQGISISGPGPRCRRAGRRSRWGSGPRPSRRQRGLRVMIARGIGTLDR